MEPEQTYGIVKAGIKELDHQGLLALASLVDSERNWGSMSHGTLQTTLLDITTRLYLDDKTELLRKMKKKVLNLTEKVPQKN